MEGGREEGRKAGREEFVEYKLEFEGVIFVV